MAATAIKGKGKAQRKNSKKGRVREPELSDLYVAQAKDIDLDLQEFRITALRPDSYDLPIDNIVESVDWSYDAGDPVLHGQVNMRKPHPAVQKVTLREGHMVKLECKWLGVWREVWRMRMRNGTIDSVTGAWTFELNDDMVILQESRDNFHYVKSKKKGKPDGWLAHQILADVARRYRIPLGAVVAGKHRITNLSMTNASPMKLIQRIYALEREATGRRFVICWRNGKLCVLPMVRNPLLNRFDQQITAAQLGQQERKSTFASALTVRASVKNGKRKRKKVTYTYVDSKTVAREGFVHRTYNAGSVDSIKAADAKAKRYIAKNGVRKRTASITHYGIAFLRRGDAVQIEIPSEGFTGEKGIAWISEGTWSLSSGSFTMDLALTLDDPYKDLLAERQKADAKARRKKRDKRKKK